MNNAADNTEHGYEHRLRPLSAEAEAALAGFEQEMELVVIPAIEEAVNERLRAAIEMREWLLKS